MLSLNEEKRNEASTQLHTRRWIRDLGKDLRTGVVHSDWHHRYLYNDCLQAPPMLTRWLVRERKTTPLSTFERLLFYTYFILVPVFPI